MNGAPAWVWGSNREHRLLAGQFMGRPVAAALGVHGTP